MPGDVLGHEGTAEKTGTDSALRELVIWVGRGRGIQRDNKITTIDEADWLGAVEGALAKPRKSD